MSSYIFSTQHLIVLMICLIAGICFAMHPAWSLLFFSTSLCLIYYDNQRAILFALACCFFFIGSTRYHQNRDLYFTHNELLNTSCNIIATVEEIMPRLDDKEQICISLHVKEVHIRDEKYHINKTVYLFIPSYITLWIKPYQEILIKNIILKHPKPGSYQEYLIRDKVWAIAHQKNLWYTTIKKPSLFMQQIAMLQSMPLQHSFSQLTQTLYISIFCGKKLKSERTTEIKRLFQYWGISHQLARSGLHLVILIWLLLLIFSYIPCSSTRKQCLILCLLVIYYLSTYSSVAFMRAFYMYIFYVICKQLNLASNPMHILCVTALLILILNPHHLFFLDFQLSFSITLLILWFCQKTQNSKTVASS